MPASCCNCTGSDVLLIRFSTKFDLDLCLTFLNFQAGSIWEDLANVITLHKLPVSSCNLIVVFCTSKSWDKLDVDLCVTFLNFQTCSRSGCLVNMLTPQHLHASCCNFTDMFSTSKSRKSPNCLYCNNIVDIRHFLLSCEKTRNFWQSYFLWWNRVSSTKITLNYEFLEGSILFGFQTNGEVFDIGRPGGLPCTELLATTIFHTLKHWYQYTYLGL